MMQRFLPSLVFSCFVFHATTGLAGMVSGGAELQTDQFNPWFLENVSEVRYCMEIDPEHFGTSLTLAHEKFLEAVEYWKGEFQKTKQSGAKKALPFPFQVATQKFLQKDCSQDHDLALQMGVLHGDQKAIVGNVSTIVGIAVRTEYSEKLLKGRGYIYISPETGPLALRADLGIRKNRWSEKEGSFLKQVFIHELGHVFGLRHNGISGNVMQENFAETVVSTKRVKPVDLSIPFFALPDGYIMRRSYHYVDDDFYTIQKLLGVPQSLYEMKYVARVQDSQNDTLDTYEHIFSPDSNEAPKSHWASSRKRRQFKDEVAVFVTKKQEVSPSISDAYLKDQDNATIGLYSSISFKSAGTLLTSDQRYKSQVIFDYAYGAFKISGFGPNGEVILDNDLW